MGLREHVNALLISKGVQGLARLKANSAVSTLLEVLGDVPLNEGPPMDSGSIIQIAGDDNRWVVTWVYEDGGMDLIKEGAQCSDSLIGWIPGQSMLEYDKGILAVEIPELKETERTKPAPPLFATPPAPPKEKKPRKSRAKASP